jgi:hypothetical protein
VWVYAALSVGDRQFEESLELRPSESGPEFFDDSALPEQEEGGNCLDGVLTGSHGVRVYVHPVHRDEISEILLEIGDDLNREFRSRAPLRMENDQGWQSGPQNFGFKIGVFDVLHSLAWLSVR